MSREAFFSFTRLVDVRLSACNDPLSQEALEGLPWSCECPDVPGGRPRVFCTHGNTFFLPLTCARRSDSLCSDGVKSRRLNVSVSQLWVLGRRTSIFPGRCCVHHAAGGGYSLQDVWRSRSRRSRLSSLGRSGAVFSFIVLQDALSEVLKVCPPMKLKFFCGRNHSFDGRTEQRDGRHCGKGPESDENGSGGEGANIVTHGRTEGRKEQSHCVMLLFGREASGMQQKKRTCHQCGNFRSELENEKEAVGSKGAGEKEEVRCEVFHCQWESRL